MGTQLNTEIENRDRIIASLRNKISEKDEEINVKQICFKFNLISLLVRIESPCESIGS